MLVFKCSNSKYRIGLGPCVFDSEAEALRAYKGYLWYKYRERASQFEGKDIPNSLSLIDLDRANMLGNLDDLYERGL